MSYSYDWSLQQHPTILDFVWFERKKVDKKKITEIEG
jgi:hypothetical protein